MVNTSKNDPRKEDTPIAQLLFDDALKHVMKAPPQHETAKKPQQKKPASKPGLNFETLCALDSGSGRRASATRPYPITVNSRNIPQPSQIQTSAGVPALGRKSRASSGATTTGVTAPLLSIGVP